MGKKVVTKVISELKSISGFRYLKKLAPGVFLTYIGKRIGAGDPVTSTTCTMYTSTNYTKLSTVFCQTNLLKMVNLAFEFVHVAVEVAILIHTTVILSTAIRRQL